MAKYIEDTIEPLTSIPTSRGSPFSSSSPAPSQQQPPKQLWCRRHSFFPKSKGAKMILIWNAVVGAIFGSVIYSIIGVAYDDRNPPATRVVFVVVGGFALVAFAQMLAYPVGGLISDLCCGRYRIIFLSLFKIWCGSLVTCIIAIVILVLHHFPKDDIMKLIIRWFLVPMVYLFIVAGFTGFQANSVQFGLDQLLDSPSEELSVFLHWFVWTQNLGELSMRLFAAALPCKDYLKEHILPYVPIVCTLIIGSLFLFTCCKHSWFHNEPRTHNPYGTVYKVLKYVAQHDKPERRSAMTYADDERPTRMEYPKERFGGPFSTETVEDVKTFLRILGMLFFISPVFFLYVSTSYVWPLYAIHLGSEPVNDKYGCNVEWMLLQSGNLSYIVTVVLLPLYLFFLHPHMPRLMPKILHRLLVGVVVMVATVIIMLCILTAAKHHALHVAHKNDTKCLFLSEVRVGIKNYPATNPLQYYTSLLIIPNILNGISVPLVYVTILEFVSAQSPHTMKGLLLGIFYAFRGLFLMLGCLFIFFFTREKWWEATNKKEYDCGFSYYLISTMLGLVVIVTAFIAVRLYHYRVRQDKPYDRAYVEEYYQRYTRLASNMAENSEEVNPPTPILIDTSILAYGTMVGT